MVYGCAWQTADGAEGLTAWAAARGSARSKLDRHLPRTTPLLAGGELHGVDEVVRGGSRPTSKRRWRWSPRDDARFTVAVTHVPKAKRFAPWMLCHRVEDEHLLGRAAL